MRRLILATVMLLGLLGTNVACNTVHGIGQDVQKAGEETQEAADRVKKKL
jgi:predicted small secreted protein